MAHTSDDNAAQAWFEKGLAEGRKQAAYEHGLTAGRSGQQPEAAAPASSPARHATTMEALARAGAPAGLQGSTGLSAATGATPAPAAAAAADTVDWDAVATSLNAKTEAQAARAGRRVAYGRSR